MCRAILVLLVALAWGATVKYNFVWDDHYFIVDNTGIRTLKNIPAMFTSRIAEASNPADVPNFRPLRNVVYAALYQLGGGGTRPWMFHLANVLGHAAAVLLLFSVASLLFEPSAANETGRWAALVTAAAFAISPAASEAVCWAKSLDDILAAVFVLAATREVLLWRGERKRVVAAVIYFALAAYSKESAAPFAGLVFFLWRFAHKLSWPRCALMTAPFAGLAVIYMANREFVLGRAAQCAPISGTYAQTLIDTSPAVGIYFRLLWGIPPFSIDYTNMKGHLALTSATVVFGATLLVVWLILLLLSARSEKLAPATLGLLWLGFFLLPVSNLIPMLQYLAERFLYLPMIGWFLALGAVVKFALKYRITYAVAGLFFVFWLCITWQREGIWQDEVTLFTRSSLDQPGHTRLRINALQSIFQLPTLHSNFGVSIDTLELQVASNIPRGDAQDMIPTLEQAHSLLPDEPRLTSALGIAYATAGQITNAAAMFELATEQAPKDARSWTDLGSVYALEKKDDEARRAWERALQIDPTNHAALDHLRLLKAK